MPPSDELLAYLTRMGLDTSAPPPPPTLATLTALQVQHGRRFPFENIDPATCRRVGLNEERLMHKVRAGRGGYCFEQTTLLVKMFKELGFNCRIVLARVIVHPVLSPMTHAVVVVTLEDGEYLVDTGYGAGSPRMPIPLPAPGGAAAGEVVYRQYSEAYRFEVDTEFYPQGGALKLQRWSWEDYAKDAAGAEVKNASAYWLSHYVFHSGIPAFDVDLAMGSHYVSTYTGPKPNFFTQSIFCNVLTATGRVTLSGGKLKVLSRTSTADFDDLAAAAAAAGGVVVVQDPPGWAPVEGPSVVRPPPAAAAEAAAARAGEGWEVVELGGLMKVAQLRVETQALWYAALRDFFGMDLALDGLSPEDLPQRFLV